MKRLAETVLLMGLHRLRRLDENFQNARNPLGAISMKTMVTTKFVTPSTWLARTASK